MQEGDTMGVLSWLGLKKESFSNFFQSVVRGWKGSFIEDVYGEKILTPHEEMVQARTTYNTDAHVAAAVITLKDFVIGGEIGIDTDDPAIQEYFADFFNRSGFKQALAEAIENMLITGNGYIEIGKTPDGKILKFFPVPKSETIYVQPDSNGNPIYYVQEIPQNWKHKDAGFYTITYIRGTEKRVYGIKIPADRMIHLKYGVGDLPWYGRSPLASAINDTKIEREIERAMAVFTRYKAIPKKLIVVKGGRDEDVEIIAKELSQSSDFENPIVATGMDTEITINDLTYAGQMENLGWMIDYLKRKKTVALAPEYIIHGEDVNRATSREQRLAFMLRVQAIREIIEAQILPIIKEIARQKGFDPTEIRGMKFGALDLRDEAQVRSEVLAMWNAGLITLNEARSMLGLPEVDEEIGSLYAFDLKGVSVMTGGEEEGGEGENEEGQTGA